MSTVQGSRPNRDGESRTPDNTLRRFTDPDGRPFPARDLCFPHEGDNWWRWEIATTGSPVALLREITRRWEPPFAILYVLVVSRGPETGRYQSPDLEAFQPVDDFLSEFRSLIEQDGRHELWLHQRGSARKAVFSRNDVLHLYGDEEAGERLLASGYAPARPVVPFPHAHNYHEEFDADERRLLARWEWRHHRLHPGDGN